MRPSFKVVLFAAAALFAVVAWARPPGTLPLGLNLNGESVRSTNLDGGAQGLFSSGSTVAWTTVRCGEAYKVVCPETAANLCHNPPAVSDGGFYHCTNAAADLYYGEPITAGGFVYFIAQDCTNSTTKALAAVSSTDAGVSCPVFRMR